MYKLDQNNDMPLLPWDHVFSTLSLSSIGLFYKLLRFPAQPPKELRQIARDFVIIFAQERGVDCPFALLNNLLISNDTNLDRNQVLFHNVFRILEKQSVADVVYKWAINTHHNYDFRDIANLFAWGHLMRECAVTQVAKNGISPNNRIPSGKIALLINHWMRIYRSNPLGLPDVPPPMLSESQLATFYNIIFQFEYERLELKDTIDLIKSSTQTKWDRFVVRGILLQGWISIEGKFRIGLDEWNTISSELDTKEIERWVKKHGGHYPDLEIPLPSFV